MGMGYPAEKGWKDIETLCTNLSKQIGGNKFELLKLKNAGHLDQEDASLYDQFVTGLFVNVAFQNISFIKKEGDPYDCSASLAFLQLEFLHKIGHHNDTFDLAPL